LRHTYTITAGSLPTGLSLAASAGNLRRTNSSCAYFRSWRQQFHCECGAGACSIVVSIVYPRLLHYVVGALSLKWINFTPMYRSRRVSNAYFFIGYPFSVRGFALQSQQLRYPNIPVAMSAPLVRFPSPAFPNQQ